MTDAWASGSLTDALNSASSSGFSMVNGPTQTALPCQHKTPPPRRYQPCDIAKLTLELAHREHKALIALTKQRRRETIGASVNVDYKPLLVHHDLVIEVLADNEAEVVTQSWWGGTPSEEGAAADEDGDDDNAAASAISSARTRAPLGVKLTSVPSASHNNFAPKHPHTSLRGGGQDLSTDGGQPLTAKVFAAPAVSTGESVFERVWPFNPARVAHYNLEGESCGVVAQGSSVTDLAMRLIVMPSDEWKITLGIPVKGEYSRTDSRSRNEKVDGPDGVKKKAVVIVHAEKKGEEPETTVTTAKFDPNTSKKTTTKKEVKSKYFLWADTTTSSTTQTTYGAAPYSMSTEKGKPNRFKIERTCGGQKVDVDLAAISKFIDMKNSIENIFDTIKDIFDEVKIGWHISFDLKVLEGEAEFSWGQRWPDEYVEDFRVYYVERFISIGGKLTILHGTIDAMVGIEFDPTWLPLSFTAKFFLKLDAKLEVGLHGDAVWRNATGKDLHGVFKIDLDASCKLEIGIEAGGRCLGYSVEASLVLHAGVTIKGDAKFTFRTPPELKIKGSSDDVKVTGDVIVLSESAQTYQFDPLILVKERVLFEGEQIW